jgi:hypothetical protein
MEHPPANGLGMFIVVQPSVKNGPTCDLGMDPPQSCGFQNYVWKAKNSRETRSIET